MSHGTWSLGQLYMLRFGKKALIDNVIGFANAKINHPDQLKVIFADSRRIPVSSCDVPSLRTIRDVQRLLRNWLVEVAGTENFGGIETPFVGALRDVKIEGRFGYLVSYPNDDNNLNAEHHITHSWWIAEASLRSICGLAIGSIFEEGLANRIRICAFDSCDRFFIAYRSRGVPRKYCFDGECENRRDAARQKVYRENP